MALHREVFSVRERRDSSFLIIDRELSDLEILRSSLVTMGVGATHAVSDHDSGLKVISQRNFTHLLFPASGTNMSAIEFLRKAMQLDSRMIAIATSYEPSVDDVFELLKIGAKGFLVKPFTTESLEAAVVEASKGQGFSRAILDAQDRNEAFSAVLAASLDKLADAQRTARSLNRETPALIQTATDFEASVRLAKTFAKDGEHSLVNRMVDFFVRLSEGPATRLGRLRRRLAERRVGHSSEAEVPTKSEKDKD